VALTPRTGRRAVAEQVERDHRLLRPALHEDERDQREGREQDQAAHLPAEPVVEAPVRARLALLRQPDQQRDQAEGEHGDAQVVDVTRRARPAAQVGQRRGDHDQGQDAHRQVDVEDPAPVDVVRQKAAEERPDDEAEPEHGAEQALVAAPLLRAEQVADDRQRDREQGAGAQALDAAERDELAHGLGDAGER
jgi:hypothetical protein